MPCRNSTKGTHLNSSFKLRTVWNIYTDSFTERIIKEFHVQSLLSLLCQLKYRQLSTCHTGRKKAKQGRKVAILAVLADGGGGTKEAEG
jgi:hypothetical protein